MRPLLIAVGVMLGSVPAAHAGPGAPQVGGGNKNSTVLGDGHYLNPTPAPTSGGDLNPGTAPAAADHSVDGAGAAPSDHAASPPAGSDAAAAIPTNEDGGAAATPDDGGEGPHDADSPPSARTPKAASSRRGGGSRASAAPAGTDSAAATAAEHDGRTAAIAKKMAQAMKSDAGPDASQPGGAAAKTAPAPKRGDGPSGTRPLDLAHPRSVSELALAAGPYAHVFAAAGLRAGADASGRPVILRADGTAASSAELARLREGIQAEPSLLASDPLLYSKIKREDYRRLGGALTEQPELRNGPLRDVAKSSDERDLVWDVDCDKISGKCNESARMSYKKGKLVSADDLTSIWERIRSRRTARFAAAAAAGTQAATKGGPDSAAAADPQDQDDARAPDGALDSPRRAARAGERGKSVFSRQTGRGDAPVPEPELASPVQTGPKSLVVMGLLGLSALFFMLAAKRGRSA